MNVGQERDLASFLLELHQPLKSYFAVKSLQVWEKIWDTHNNSTARPLTFPSKRPLGNAVWHEARGGGFVGGLWHCIWEVLQSQPSCRRQHSNEVINNLQQLLRERDLIC